MPEVRQNQKRTAIIYFGPEQADYLNLVQAENRREFLAYIQRPLQEQIGLEQHKSGCSRQSSYTVHGLRERRVQGWLGETRVIPICRVRCQGCRAVFTVLPSFLMRYRRQDTDYLGKLMEMNLVQQGGSSVTVAQSSRLQAGKMPARRHGC